VQEGEAVNAKPLKSWVSKRGGIRLASHSKLRDQLVDWAIESWPAGDDRLEETLKARLAIRTKEKYGSVLAAFLIPVFVNVIVHLIVKWWESRRENRLLMEQWVAEASEG
jgi:hypothetical protein